MGLCALQRSHQGPFVPARGTPRRLRRGDPVAGTQSYGLRPLGSRFRGNERSGLQGFVSFLGSAA